LRIRWDPPEFDGNSEIEWYSIYRTDPSGITASLKNVDRNKTFYDDNSVIGGSYYSYNIYALNKIGRSLPSETAGGKTFGIPQIPEIVNVSVVSNRVVLKWEMNSTLVNGAHTGFNVYRVDPQGQVDRLATLMAEIRIFLDGDVLEGESYEYFITSFNSAGESENSGSFTVSIPVSDPVEKDSNYALTWTLSVILFAIIFVIAATLFIRRENGPDDESMMWGEE
jgi:hypothetical protein